MNRQTSSAVRVEEARSLIDRLFRAGLLAVDPREAVHRTLFFQDGELLIGDARIRAPGGFFIAAVGKAAAAMALGAMPALESASVSGQVITKDGHGNSRLPSEIVVYEAGHPIPDERGVHATRELLSRLDSLGSETVVLALISGGGSALLEAPRDGVTLGDLAVTTDQLLRAGAPIDALNAVRAPLSRVKAGGLRAAAPESTWVTLILSDVLGNDPRVIASGPTIPNLPDAARALEVIERYGLGESLPRSVVDALQAESTDSVVADAANDLMVVIGDNAAAVKAAAEAARSIGLRSDVVWSAAEGEAARLGGEFVQEVAEAAPETDIVLGGGEATVTVRGDGNGGRNTEFALAAAIEMERRGLDDWAVASLATDGQDAMTGLAGAIADRWTCERARKHGIEPAAALAGNDSATVFLAAGGAVATGPTGTNVNDLYIAVRLHVSDRWDD